MKIKKSTVIWLIVLIWCLFMGITAISMGFGSLFPSMNLIAKPFVCTNGQAEVDSQNYQVSPVESGTILTWYCVDEQSGTKTKINPFVINFYAGLFYGSLLFVVILSIWYFYSKWDPSKASPQARKWVSWIQTSAFILFIVGLTLFNLMPLFRSIIATTVPTSVQDAAATSTAFAFHQMSSGTPIAFTSTEKPLASWKGIPIMSEAVAGQQVNKDRYIFKVEMDSETILSFYKDTLKSLGWNIEDTQWLGMKFTKENSILLVTASPAVDMQSWIVTLILTP